MTNANLNHNRPSFPLKAVITGGMPYGNKDLHFGHIGGMFVQADAYARFLRDRIGKENVLFVSGTDCYGSPIVEYFRRAKETGEFSGTLEEFVAFNHNRQKDVLNSYQISLNSFAASGLGSSKITHEKVCANVFAKLKENGHLLRMESPQFFDPKLKVLLNGRQVTGFCPVPGCKSERGYADECSLGHPYEPRDLISPKSSLSGEVPELKLVSNWYLNLETFRSQLQSWTNQLENKKGTRPYVVSGIREFLEKPALYLKKEQVELLESLKTELPPFEFEINKNQALKVSFESLELRNKANEVFNAQGIRHRNGKTLVPFRLTGNVEWGVPVPKLEGVDAGATFWVWPESLLSPISFVADYLEKNEKGGSWESWFQSSENALVQFIGEDNLYFYSIAELCIFLGMQGKNAVFPPPNGQVQCQNLVVNNHILFFDKKASSSGNLKPPMARDLLHFYTSDQLRAHFLALGLGVKSVGFKPKPLNPDANEKEGDPVLKDGNLLCNAFNKALRTAFYTASKYLDGKIPVLEVSAEILQECETAILKYENAMAECAFHDVMAVLDSFIRSINKYWTTHFKPGELDFTSEPNLKQHLVNSFHLIRVATVLVHPIAPEGSEKVREYWNLNENFWSWNSIFKPWQALVSNPEGHKIQELGSKFDFFPKHPSQF